MKQMMNNEKEFNAALERPANHRLSVGGSPAKFDRMNLDIREFLWSHPGQKTVYHCLIGESYA
jgi:hypothetical protein